MCKNNNSNLINRFSITINIMLVILLSIKRIMVSQSHKKIFSLKWVLFKKLSVSFVRKILQTKSIIKNINVTLLGNNNWFLQNNKNHNIILLIKTTFSKTNQIIKAGIKRKRNQNKKLEYNVLNVNYGLLI